MRAMVLVHPKEGLELKDIQKPSPSANQVLVKVEACGVCRTDIHLLDADLPNIPYPIIPGHQIVGRVEACGSEVKQFKKGERVGIPWLGRTCGKCSFCKKNLENLCEKAEYTGYTLNGGFAEFVTSDELYCFSLSSRLDAKHLAPLLCGGLIGYRSYRMAGSGKSLGFFGFGSAAHMLIQLANHEGKDVYVFTRPGDDQGQQFAKKMGAKWTGGSDEISPVLLDAAIIFAPVGALVPHALKSTNKGGRVVCAGIHMSDIPSFPYRLLWEERSIQSVANLTRKDGDEFLKLAADIPIKTSVETYALESANDALYDLRKGSFNGTAVLIP